MKKINFYFVLLVFSCFLIEANAQVSLPSNTVGSPDPYIGTSDNFNVNFKRAGIFSGQLGESVTSFGLNAFNNFFDVSKQTTVFGVSAGQYNNPENNAYPYLSRGMGNSYFGYFAGRGVSGVTSTAYNNVCVGAGSGQDIITGSLNVFVGEGAGKWARNSNQNVFVGRSAGMGISGSTSGNGGNVCIGNESGVTNQGSNNTYLGGFSGHGPVNVPTTGSRNTYLGFNCGLNMISGSGNTFIGTVILPSGIATNITSGENTSGTIVLADGNSGGFGLTGNQRLYIHNNGNTGIDIGNNTIPQNRLVINSQGAATGTLGLRFNNCPMTSIANPTNKVLSVNNLGDVILVEDKEATNGDGITSTCNSANFVTKSSGTNGDITCSSIYDDGLGHVGFGFGSSLPGTSFNVMFAGNIANYGGSYNVSDKKFKKDIKPIQNALDKIMNLDGKTYFWNKEVNKDIDFTSELQYGLLAQDVQKIIPSLVIESENGDLAMNYTGLIPVLIEALKEQQSQINELKQQMSESFKVQNQDLLQFSNTKIISVSPNPSNDVITVSLNIEKEVQTATLQVHDINGTILSNLNLKERNTNITKTLQKDNFGKGIYVVSLVVNGKSIDTKKIIFN